MSTCPTCPTTGNTSEDYIHLALLLTQSQEGLIFNILQDMLPSDPPMKQSILGLTILLPTHRDKSIIFFSRYTIKFLALSLCLVNRVVTQSIALAVATSLCYTDTHMYVYTYICTQ